jgi:hypothetical protein
VSVVHILVLLSSSKSMLHLHNFVQTTRITHVSEKLPLTVGVQAVDFREAVVLRN